MEKEKNVNNFKQLVEKCMCLCYIDGKVRLLYECIADQYAGNVIEAENSDGDCSCD